ncbi:NADP-dependent oxidoreductase [Aliikangiella marina]|uniref:NADP-dependent oxidoreductase n=1 Tax=Aliikangiella marina TaxID=1712262 RepID=UPI001AED86EB|nr:NADP-dependent oxidoreductase [Aliikangiella marina]
MGQSLINHKWVYVARPESEVGYEHYEMQREEMTDDLSANQVLIANQYLSVDPYMRIQQAASHTWEEPHPLNSLQQSGVIGKILASASSKFKPGDWVNAYTGWEKFSKVSANELVKLDPTDIPVTTSLGILGMPGRTAWFGLIEAGKPKPGETLVVSGASGAVGSLVVQFAKKIGCKVIAFAGSDEKCRWLEKSLGADLAINYKHFNCYRELQSFLEEKRIDVDVYFDNVGGMISDAVIPLISLHARVVICGQMSQYNGMLDEVQLGPRFLHHILYKRATIQGILARDFSHRMEEMVEIVGPWVKEGSIVYQESIVHGFEKMPEHLASLFDRGSSGKLLVRIGDEY